MTNAAFAGLLLLLAQALALAAPPVRLYVATDGNDSWSGRLPAPSADGTDGPLASLTGARNVLRRWRAENGPATAPIEVLIRGGVYRMAEPLILEPEDSGSADAPVTYAAYPDEKPVLSGGVVISGWRRGDGDVWEAVVPAESRSPFQQLFVNGQRRMRARTPNEGWFTVAGKAPPQVDPATGAETAVDRTAFIYGEGDIKPWPNLNEVNVVVYHSWETSRLRIRAVDEAHRVVHFTGPSCWPFEYWGPGQRYYVENVPQALDAPGEWYLDPATGVLRYIPLPGEDMSTAEVVAPRLTRLVELRGDAELGLCVSNVTFRGLGFHHQDWTLGPEGHSDPQAAVTAPAAIMADGAIDCAFEGCEIAHVGDYALWLRRGCKGNRIVRCRLHDLGAGGIRVGEATMAQDDAAESSHNLVDNNHIFDGGHVYPAGVGIWVAQSSFNTLSHNEVHDLNYSGMSIGWNWDDQPNRCHHNLIEYNHVHHVMRGQLSDGGAIYTLGTSSGSVIRNNVFHDVWPYPQPPIGWGIYLDATCNGYLVENNVVYNTLSGGLMYANGGHEHVIQNNIFALSADYALWPYWERRPNTFRRNIVYFTQGLLFWPYREDTIKERQQRGESLGEWDWNLYWNPNEPDIRFFRHRFANWQLLGLDRNSVIADPRFVDVHAHDFRLKPDSPAFGLGFQQIDTSAVGLYGDPDWVAEARLTQHSPTVLPPPGVTSGPVPINDGFEVTAAGAPPRGAVVSGEGKGASIRVTSEQAASGRHSLKITDAPGLDQVWEPHFFYQPQYLEGTVRVSFSIRLTPQSLLFVEWRDNTPYPACIGPSVTFTGAGEVLASGRLLTIVPVEQWVRVQMDCTLGEERPSSFILRITPGTDMPQVFDGLPISGSEFRALQWLGFVSIATDRAVTYLDDMRIDSPNPE